MNFDKYNSGFDHPDSRDITIESLDMASIAQSSAILDHTSPLNQ